MRIVLNGESTGVGKPSNVPIGLRAIRRMLPTGFIEFQAIECPNRFALVSDVKGLESIIANAVRLSRILDQEEPRSSFPLVSLGGDCGSELIPIARLNHKFGGRLQVVWLDAHGDLNTPESSPSGAFHGMILRSLCGEGPKEILSLVHSPLHSQRVILAGVRDLDLEEERYTAMRNIPILSSDYLNRCPSVIRDSLNVEEPVYLHVDYDVLDGTDHPESTYPVCGGVTLDALVSAIRLTRSARNVVGMSLTEFAPKYNDNAFISVQRILTEAFGLSLGE